MCAAGSSAPAETGLGVRRRSRSCPDSPHPHGKARHPGLGAPPRPGEPRISLSLSPHHCLTFSLTRQELLCSRLRRYSSRHWLLPGDSWEISGAGVRDPAPPTGTAVGLGGGRSPPRLAAPPSPPAQPSPGPAPPVSRTPQPRDPPAPQKDTGDLLQQVPGAGDVVVGRSPQQHRQLEEKEEEEGRGERRGRGAPGSDSTGGEKGGRCSDDITVGGVTSRLQAAAAAPQPNTSPARPVPGPGNSTGLAAAPP